MFGDILQELRKDKKWTQADLAKKLGVSKSAVGTYETGLAEPTFDNLIKISDLFHVNIDYLLGHHRDQTSWSDLTTELKLETGSITLSKLNEAMKSLNLHDRSAVVEHMQKLIKLQQLEMSIGK